MKQTMALVFAISIVCTSLSGLSQVTQRQTTCAAKPDWFLKVERPDTGWNLGIVNRQKKIVADSHTLSSNAAFKDVFVAEYALRGKYFAFTEVVADPCEHSVALRTQHLRVEHAYGYSIHGKTFAIVLAGNCGQLEKGQWIAAGCDTRITLVDTTGSGKFGLLKFGAFEPDSVPDWASRTSPPLIVNE